MAILTSRDIGETERQLAVLLQRHVPGMRDVLVEVLPSPSATGFSSETVLFDATFTSADGTRATAALVARIKPSGYSLYQDHDLESQWRVIDALHRHSDVPVPAIVAHDTSNDASQNASTSSPLGQPVFVMQRITGRAAADSPPYTVRGWLHEASPDQQRAVYERGLDVVARIHAVDWRALGLEFLRDSTVNPVGLRDQLRHDERFAEWVVGDRSFPLFVEASSWLAANVPDDGELLLSWGDARLGNMLFDEFEPTAVLDWEMATLAAPAADLAWWLVFNQIHTVGIGKPNLPGIPDDDEAIAFYEQCHGAPVNDLLFYEVRAALRAALLLVKYTDALVEAGQVSADAPKQAYTPAMNVLERLLAP